MGESKCFIAVHAGAGYHSLKRESEYRKACSRACQTAMKRLAMGMCAVDAVAAAVQDLENASCTNAGVGSSLTLRKTVECDASVMDGSSLKFGAVGAITNVRNPVVVARRLVQEQTNGSLSLGRVPPCCMVGPGATDWAKSHGINPVSNEDMLSVASIKTYEDHKKRLEAAENRRLRKRKNTNFLDPHCPVKVSQTQQDKISDTVGAICVDCHGNTAAAASSGGVSLKQPGRIGPAACYGAGCWAANEVTLGKVGVAVTTSGTGEQLMSTLLARECAECLQRHEDSVAAFQQTFTEKFLDSAFLQDVEDKYGGVLALRLESSDSDGRQCELVWGHSTDSMCVGYMVSGSKPKTILSRMADDKKPGKTFVMEGHFFQL